MTQCAFFHRDALARHGPGDPEIHGTARHGKSWHGKSWHGPARKILARKNIGTSLHEKSCHMDTFQIKFYDFCTNSNPRNHISELPDFRKIGPYSSGDHFFESCPPQKMMQNRIDEILWGQTFKNTSYFTLGTSEFWVLGHGLSLIHI